MSKSLVCGKFVGAGLALALAACSSHPTYKSHLSGSDYAALATLTKPYSRCVGDTARDASEFARTDQVVDRALAGCRKLLVDAEDWMDTRGIGKFAQQQYRDHVVQQAKAQVRDIMSPLRVTTYPVVPSVVPDTITKRPDVEVPRQTAEASQPEAAMTEEPGDELVSAPEPPASDEPRRYSGKR